MNDRPILSAFTNTVITTVIRAATGGPVPARTLRFWASVGLEMPDGSRVKLRAERHSGQYQTCAEWVRDFLAATSQVRRKPAHASIPV